MRDWRGRPLENLAEQAEALEKLVFWAQDDQNGLDRRRAELAAGLRRLGDRRALNRLEPPLTAALIGPTGVGKSKVFNSLIGRNLSPSGYKRPTTPQPVLAAAPQELDKFASPHFLPSFSKKRVESPPAAPEADSPPTLYLVEAGPRLAPGLALIDTPDFDSVLSLNRAAAIQIFQRCDAVIIVADEGKYADQALWDFISRLKDSPKEAFILLNRAGPQAEAVAEDFKNRLREAGLALPVAVWPEDPHLKDQDILGLDFEDGRRLRNWVTTAAAGRKNLQKAIIEAEQAEINAALEHLLDDIGRQLTEYDRLEKRISALHDQAVDGLGASLTVNLSDEVKAALLEKLKELFNRFDVLAKPRKFLLAPFVALKEGWRKRGRPGQTGEPSMADLAEARAISQILAEGGESLIIITRDLGRRQSSAVAASALGPRLSERPDFTALPLTPDQIRTAYQTAQKDLEEWVAGQAHELVKNLGLGEKAAFYTAQLVTMGLIVSLQIHTGGGFSLLDGLTDGLVAPLLARLAGAAISKDKIKDLETKAAAKHLAGAKDILVQQTERFLDFLVSARGGLEAASEIKVPEKG